MIDEHEVMVDVLVGEMHEIDDADETDHIRLQVVADIEVMVEIDEILDIENDETDESEVIDIIVKIVVMQNQIRIDEEVEMHYDECIDLYYK